MADSNPLEDLLSGAKQIPSYFFGDRKGGPLSYESLQTRRRIAEALLGKRSPFPKTIGEGLTYFGEALGDRMVMNQLDEQDQKLAAMQPGLREGAAVPPPTSIEQVAPSAAVATPPAPAPAATPPYQPPPPAPARPAVAAPIINPATGEPRLPTEDEAAALRSYGTRSYGTPGPDGTRAPPMPQVGVPSSGRIEGPAVVRPTVGPGAALGDPREGINGVTRALLAQRGVIPPDPTEGAGLPPRGSATAALMGGDTASDAPPIGAPGERLAQAPSFGERFGFGNPPIVRDDLQRAPPAGYDPTKTPIPAPQDLPFPDPGKDPTRPPLIPQSPTQQKLRALMTDPYANAQTRQWAAEQFQLHEKAREELQKQQQEDFTHRRGQVEEAKKAERTYKLEQPKRMLDQHIGLLDMQAKQAEAANQPVVAAQKRFELEKLMQDVAAGKTVTVEGRVLKHDPVTGALSDITPKPKAEDIKLTQEQTRAYEAYSSGMLASAQMAGKEEVLANWLNNKLTGRYVPFSNAARAQEYQRVGEAAQVWVQTFLRHDSGATIRPEETADFMPRYFPMPFDTPATIADKAQRRARREDAIYEGLGTARPIADELKARFAPGKPDGTTRIDQETGQAQVVRGGVWTDVKRR
jgi:hypothetical protein